MVEFCASTRRDGGHLLPAGEDHGRGKSRDRGEEFSSSVASLLDQKLAEEDTTISAIDHHVVQHSTHSRMTRADIASTMGIARGTTHGS